MNFQAVTVVPSELGESPFWHPTEQLLYWVDIPGRKIMRAKADGASAAQSWSMPSEPGCIAPAVKGGLVIALRDGIYRAPSWGGELQLLHRFPYDSSVIRFNDGKADTLGRYWAGTLCDVRTSTDAELFVLDCRDGRAPEARRMAGNSTIANGLAWSPDNGTIYWADTQSQIIKAWDWESESNTMSNERVFQQFAPKPADWVSGMPGYGGRPDGAAVDTHGNYYVAMFEGARLLKFAPNGDLLAEIPTPVQCPTMPCFGGDDLQTLYITTSRDKRPATELAAMPQSGCVFAVRVDTPGLPVNFFRD